MPDLDRALYCRPQRVTLYHEGSIMPDEVQVFEVLVPSDFAKAKGPKSIIATLAYDPPVSVVNRDRPAGIKLTWRLARGDVTLPRLQAAIAAEGREEDAGQSSCFHKAVLPWREQGNGTVQKNVFSWSRGQYGETYRLAVTARAVRPAHQEAAQRFALVVSLETQDEAVNVYQLVRARAGAGRVRTRVPAA